MVGLGNAFRLPGLKQFLQEKLQLEVRKLSKFDRLVGEGVTAAPTFAENIMSFGVTYGLALQGLKQGRLSTNLLPHEVRVERMVRGKKPWAAAAAAALLIAVAGLAVAKGLENSQVTGDEINRAVKEAKATKEKVNSNNAEFKKEEDRIVQSKQNLKDLSAGTHDRLNWQYLHEYINHCLPLATASGCERVADKGEDGFAIKATLLGKGEAVEAFRKLEENRYPKLDEAVDAARAEVDSQFIKKHLVQINIEGIMALYTDDLGPYFRRIHADGRLGGLYGMDNEEKERKIVPFAKEKDAEALKKLKLPDKGWVIEIRGYTYNKGTPKEEALGFIRYTLVENLRNPEYRRNKKWRDSQPKEVQDQFAAIEEAIGKKVGYAFVLDAKKVLNPQQGEFELIGHSEVKALIAADGAGGGEKKDGGALQPGQPGQPGGPGAGNPGAGSGESKPEVKGPGRDAWSPIGDRATLVLGKSGGGGGGGGGNAVFGGGGVGVGAGAGGGGSSKGPPAPPAGGSDSGKGPQMPGGKDGPGVDPKKSSKEIERQPRAEFIVLLVWSDVPAPAAAAANPAEKKN
jgi:cytochrome c556